MAERGYFWVGGELMRKLRNSIIYLVIYLSILFNIERIDIGGPNAINISTDVYVLIVTAIIMVLAIGWFKSLNQPTLILLWTAAYFAMRAILLSHRPIVGGGFTYLTFTEWGMLTIGVVLAQILALNIGGVEKTLKDFAFANITGIPRIEEARERIQAELYRSRRFQRPLSIIILEKEWNNSQINVNTELDAQSVLMAEYVSAIIVRELSTQLRQTDFMLEHDKRGKFVIVSPDTDRPGVDRLIERLKSLDQIKLFSVNFGAATFPEQGLTFEHLMEKAETNLRQRAESSIGSVSQEKIADSQPVNVQ